jgi:hypothetical protein
MHWPSFSRGAVWRGAGALLGLRGRSSFREPERLRSAIQAPTGDLLRLARQQSMADLAIVALVATIGVLMAPASPLLIADLLAAQLAGDLTDCRDGTPRYAVRRGYLLRSSWSFYVE